MCLLKKSFQNMVFKQGENMLKLDEKIVCPTSNL